jgi:enterochelin esterase-like enzyme
MAAFRGFAMLTLVAGFSLRLDALTGLEIDPDPPMAAVVFSNDGSEPRSVAGHMKASIHASTGDRRAQPTQDRSDGSPTTLTLQSEVFANTRTLRILLPPGYDEPVNGTRRYPVFYFTDGIAAWDAWGVPEVVRKLREEKSIPELIFVGVDNGGSTPQSRNPVSDRASEYLPYADPSWIESPPEPRGKDFPKFLFDEVMPLINATYRTLPEPEHTGLAGDSYAGAAALFTAMQHPDKIGYLLLESPSLHLGGNQLLHDARQARKWPPAIYLGVGTKEGETEEIRRNMENSVRELHQILQSQPDSPRVLLVVSEGAEHSYDAWHQRLPRALTFLLQSTD